MRLVGSVRLFGEVAPAAFRLCSPLETQVEMFPDHEFVSTSDSRCGESLPQIYLTDYRRYTVNSTGVERVAEPVWVGVRWASSFTEDRTTFFTPANCFSRAHDTE